MTCYSDFPIPKEFPNFMHHTHFKKYLDLYAENFGLMKYIKLQVFQALLIKFLKLEFNRSFFSLKKVIVVYKLFFTI